MDPTNEKQPVEWCKIIGIQVRDQYGWEDGDVFGPKDWNAPITRAEFLQRAGLSNGRHS
jgi:hypothetical protein